MVAVRDHVQCGDEVGAELPFLPDRSILPDGHTIGAFHKGALKCGMVAHAEGKLPICGQIGHGKGVVHSLSIQGEAEIRPELHGEDLKHGILLVIGIAGLCDGSGSGCFGALDLMLTGMKKSMKGVSVQLFVHGEHIGVVRAFQTTAGKTVVQIKGRHAVDHRLFPDLFYGAGLVIPEEIDPGSTVLHPDEVTSQERCDSCGIGTGRKLYHIYIISVFIFFPMNNFCRYAHLFLPPVISKTLFS